MNKKQWLLISFLRHSSSDAEDGRQQGENEVPKDQARQESVFAQTLGSTAIEDHLCDVPQQEQENQCGEVVRSVRRLGAYREGRTQEKQGDESRIKQKLRAVMNSHRKTNAKTVHRNGGILVATLTCPCDETAGWSTGDGVLVVHLYLSVFLCGYLADEEVVLTGILAIMRGEAFVFEKQPLSVREVLAYAHVRFACQGRGEVHHAVLQVLETHQPVEQSAIVSQSCVADDHLGIVVVTADHTAQPLLAGGHAVEVGEHHEVVRGRFDAHREGEFLAVEEVEVLPELHRLDARLAAFQVLQLLLGLIVGAVVHHHHLKLGIILTEQHGD